MQEYLLRLEPSDPSSPLTAEIIESALRAQGLVGRVVEERAVLTQALSPEARQTRAVGEIFTYALLLWPAVVGLLALQSQGWQLALKIALAVWLGLMQLVAYRQGRGAFFGNSMLMLSACVAAFWWTHPGPWMYLWLTVIVIGVYAAVRGVLNPRAPLPGGA